MRNTRIATRLLATSALTLAVGIGAPAAALAADQASEVETLIVTANKRAENIQDVGMSVSAVSGDTIEKMGVSNATELFRYIPSVTISQSNNNRNTAVYIRGIGSNGSNPGIESSVGIFLDGVYILGAGSIQGNLTDVSTIEVLRGPQGTLYGRNTPVGAINITTREPGQAFEAMVTLRAGDYNDRAISGYVGGGISETLAGRVSVWANGRDGYEYNLSTGTDVNGKNEWGIRGRVKWTPTDNLTGNFIAYNTRIHSDCCAPDTVAASSPTGIATAGFLAAAAATGHPFRNFNDHDHVVDEDYPGLNLTKTYGASATFDYELAGGHTLTSITSFSGYTDRVLRLSADALPQDVVKGQQYLRSEGYSEELRITSPADQTVSYVAGIYLFSQGMTQTTQTALGVDANRLLPPAPGRAFRPGDASQFYISQKTRSYAAFGQATWNVTDALRLTGGLRYTRDAKDAFIDANVAPAPGFTTPAATSLAVFSINHLGKASRSENKLTWSAGIQYDLAPDVMVYAVAATGAKTGGFNARGAAPGVPFTFEPEETMTYEVGIKSTLFDHTLILNADVYDMTLSNFQDSVLNPVTGTGFIIGNAGERQVRGLELEAQWRPIPPLTIKGSAAYMNSEFTDFSAGQCNPLKAANGTKPGTCNYNGLTPSQSPEWTGSLAVNWQAPLMDTGLEWYANGDVSYVAERNLESTLDPRGIEPETTLLGLRLGITSPSQNWRVSIYGKNLTDESWFIQRVLQPVNAFISAGGLNQAQGFVGWYSPPRTVGIEASKKF